MSNQTKKQGGFTLIELMIVVVIIGILAALAIPRFMDVSIESRQREQQLQAKGLLKEIWRAEGEYFTKHHEYWVTPAGSYASAEKLNAFGELGITIPESCKYRFTVIALPDGGGFFAKAILDSPGIDDDPSPDIWEINQRAEYSAVSDDLAQ